jgi:hypothetical protein
MANRAFANDFRTDWHHHQGTKAPRDETLLPANLANPREYFYGSERTR